MKKAEPQKTTYSQLATPSYSPMPQVAGPSANVTRRWADPSSSERSNRYPVPLADFRSRPA